MTIKKIRQKYIYRSFYTVISVLFIIFLLLYIFRVNDNISIQGTIKSKNITYIKSPCKTYIKKVYVIPGEEVKTGALLAELDGIGINKSIQELKSQIVDTNKKLIDIQNRRNVYPLQIALMEQDIAQCIIKLENARIEYENSQKLNREGAVSSLEMRKSGNEYEILQSELIKLENNLTIYKIENNSRIEMEKQLGEEKMLNLQLENFQKQLALLTGLFPAGIEEIDFEMPKIISPCNGIITAITHDENSSASRPDSSQGKILEENETIFEISNPDDIFIEGFIRENDFPYVYEEDRVYLKIAAYSFQKYGVFSGIIDKLYQEPTVVNGRNMYKCEIRLMNIKSNREIKTYLGLTTYNTIDVKRSYNLIQYMLKKVFEN